MDRGELLLAVIVLVLIGGLSLVGWIGASSCEASAYNRITGKQVSTWDAMFVDLRVQDSAQK